MLLTDGRPYVRIHIKGCFLHGVNPVQVGIWSLLSIEALFLGKKQRAKQTKKKALNHLLFSPLFLPLQINNEIKKEDEKLARPVNEQMIEFSILIVGEKYSDELTDPAAVKRQLLSEQFISQVITFPDFLFLFAGSAKQY